jgi:hypothetical protein
MRPTDEDVEQLQDILDAMRDLLQETAALMAEVVPAPGHVSRQCQIESLPRA